MPRLRRPPQAAREDQKPTERSETAARPDWRDSIQLSADRPIDLIYVAASQLDAHPSNWRLHPPEQKAALAEAIGKVGFTTPPLFNLTTGRLLDGHLRKEWAGDAVIPVVVGRWTEEQERFILTTHDPITAMAKTDAAKLKQLLDGMPKIETGDLDSMLRGLVQQQEATGGVGGAAAAKHETEEQQDGVTIAESFAVLVKCDTERDQQLVIAELEKNGLDVRALTVGFPEAEPESAPPPQIAPDGLVIRREVSVKRTPRVVQMEGQFDCPPAKKNAREWRLDWKIDGDWNIGLIVGPSGSGKSTIARELFGDRLVQGWPWPADKSILDGFPESLTIPQITSLLSSVGFSSPPAWVKPFHVLSNGEQFRVNMARTLAEGGSLAVVDEFTSVVDRQVAQIGSCAIAKAVRAANRRFVAVACHYDIVDWLQPDWIVDLVKADKHNRVPLERRQLRRRPDVEVSIRRVGVDRWQLFRPHHYLSGSLHRSAKCFLAEVDGRPLSEWGCDGVLFATPTGSTGYAWSAGGPVVWPTVEAMLLVPVSAHALFARPMVVSSSTELALEVLPRSPSAVLWCDGRRLIPLEPGDRVEVVRGSRPVRLARLRDSLFVDRLVAKFQLPVQGWSGRR